MALPCWHATDITTDLKPHKKCLIPDTVLTSINVENYSFWSIIYIDQTLLLQPAKVTIMRTSTTDPVSLHDVTDLNHAPHLIQGAGDNAIDIYFESEENKQAMTGDNQP